MESPEQLGEQAYSASRPHRIEPPITRRDPGKEAHPMWPIKGILPDLPDHLHLSEDEDMIILACTRCGWTATYSALGASLTHIKADAEAHLC
jgi:hypothetical protein